ncbi:MAG: hypothetical protein Q7T86_00780 [Hyphomicrobiaceae bacterium]|jgi:hypothetical protein|nr:hypothetical protein [Hyphomicrobiaceae bacterium]
MFTPRMRHFPRAIAVLATGVLLPAATLSSVALADEITVSVTSVNGLDKVDELSGGDYFARVTIDGDAQSTPVVKDKSFKPDWKIKKSVSGGEHKLKLELIDKDLSEDDPVDINRLDNKRDLEFTVDTKSCKIEGFSSTQRCGSTITRAGKENKRAEISFKITVKKK